MSHRAIFPVQPVGASESSFGGANLVRWTTSSVKTILELSDSQSKNHQSTLFHFNGVARVHGVLVGSPSVLAGSVFYEFLDGGSTVGRLFQWFAAQEYSAHVDEDMLALIQALEAYR